MREFWEAVRSIAKAGGCGHSPGVNHERILMLTRGRERETEKWDKKQIPDRLVTVDFVESRLKRPSVDRLTTGELWCVLLSFTA